MSKKLLKNSLIKFTFAVVMVWMSIFLPAGSFSYKNGWLFMVVLFAPIFLVGVVLFLFDPELLKKRLSIKENSGKQTTVVKLSGLTFFVRFVVAGLNYRLGWFMLPMFVVKVAVGIFLLSYLIYAEVLRENKYLSRTIEVSENQQVVDKGLYRIVRHPMYTATIFLFLSMPLILGSLLSFLVFSAYPFIIARRIILEEELLLKELDGYYEYTQRVKYRLIPFIW
jgi:protein-S-isoprenylcysteine O-methyltransferase Ste14